MRIGLDVSQTCAERAGCAVYADALSRALVAAGLPRGHTFSLYHHFGEWINQDTRGGTLIDDPRVSAPLRDLNAAAARILWSNVADGQPLPDRPDVVLSFNFHAPQLPHAKLIYTVHDLAFWKHHEFATEDTRLVCQREVLKALARAAGFLFVSRRTQEEFEEFLPGWFRETGRPSLIAPAASRFLRATAPRAAGGEAPWLMVGSLEPRKNHLAALAAYELYHAHSAVRRPLVFTGGAGWKSDVIRARLAELQQRAVPVRWLGFVPDSALAALYPSAFGVLMPSWHEGFGVPVVEAMAAGVPVIASERTSLPEVGGSAAIYFPPDQPALLAEAMLALENEPGARDRRALASLDRSRAFSWEATAKSVLEFAERL